MPSRVTVSPPPVWLPMRFPRPVPFATTMVYAPPPIELPYGQKKPERRCRDDLTGSTHRSLRLRRRDRLGSMYVCASEPLAELFESTCSIQSAGQDRNREKTAKEIPFSVSDVTSASTGLTLFSDLFTKAISTKAISPRPPASPTFEPLLAKSAPPPALPCASALSFTA